MIKLYVHRHDDFDGVDRNHALDNGYDLEMHEPGNQTAVYYFLMFVYYTYSIL